MTTRGTFPDAHFYNMTIDGDVTVSSSTTNKPLFTLKNTNNGGTGAILKFDNTEASGAGADNDTLGTISFNGQDSGSATEEYVLITARAEAVTATSEQGRINFGVSVSGDGEVDSVLTLCGSSATAPTVLSGNPVIVGSETSGSCSFLTSGYTIDTAGGAQTMTASELIGGYAYIGAAGGSVALTLPGADAVQTALATVGVTTAAGLRMPPIIIDVSDANALTVTAGTGETVLGTAAVNNTCAIAHYIFTAAATATVVVCVGA